MCQSASISGHDNKKRALYTCPRNDEIDQFYGEPKRRCGEDVARREIRDHMVAGHNGTDAMTHHQTVAPVLVDSVFFHDLLRKRLSIDEGDVLHCRDRLRRRVPAHLGHVPCHHGEPMVELKG